MKNYQSIAALFFLVLITGLLGACRKTKTPPPSPPAPVLASKKAIISFKLEHENNPAFLDAVVNGSISGDTIKLFVPVESDLRTLKPSIVIDGVSVTPASGQAQNFSSPVQYTVQGEDGSTAKYTVVVKYTPTVFAGIHGGFLVSLNANTGDELWKTAIPLSASSPAVGDGLVYVAGYDSLFAFEARNGRAKWKMRLGNTGTGWTEFPPTPVFFNGVIFIGSRDGNFYALESTTGNIKWKFSNSSGHIFTGPPHIVNNILYMGSEDSVLYALNSTTGALVWKVKTNGLILSAAVSGNGNIYFQSSDAMVHAVEAGSGNLVWEKNFGGIHSSPAINKGNLYIIASDIIWALDAHTGDLKWNTIYDFNDLTYSERSSMTIRNDILYMGSLNNNLYAISSIDGNRLWTVPSLGSIRSTPTLSGGMLYIGVEGGVIHALDAATGNPRWHKNFTGNVFSSVCVVDSDGIKHYSGLIEK